MNFAPLPNDFSRDSMGIFRSIASLLAGGESLALATIVRRAGSAPRAVGSRMIVKTDGALIGTIGGGILEARVRDLALEIFGDGKSVLKEYVLTAQDAGQMGMVCGGAIQVLAQFLDATRPENLCLFREIASTLEDRERAWLINELPSGFDVPESVAQGLITGEGMRLGDLDPQTFQALSARADGGQPQVLSYREKQYFVEALCHRGAVYIFGAGHVALQLAPLARLVGFRTVVLDDRQEFASRERFPCAHEVVVLDSFQNALAGLQLNGDSYLVLVTRGHAHDQTVLRQALLTGAGYIGMIGSRRKRDVIYEALGREGFTQVDFDRVHSPIGLSIKAETPEEIAVSIAAELIQARAGRKR